MLTGILAHPNMYCEVMQPAEIVILLMEEIQLTTWDVKNPMENGTFSISQLVILRISEPSTVLDAVVKSWAWTSHVSLRTTSAFCRLPAKRSTWEVASCHSRCSTPWVYVKQEVGHFFLPNDSPKFSFNLLMFQCQNHKAC